MPVNGEYRDSGSQGKALDLKVTKLSRGNWPIAVRISQQFLEEYPERMGFGQAVVYLAESRIKGSPTSLFVYRTKTSVVVRGNR